jgi:hypothetical protein
MNTINLTPTTRAVGAVRSNPTPPSCWCGQDLEHVRWSHCPRCGTARAAALPPLWRAS